MAGRPSTFYSQPLADVNAAPGWYYAQGDPTGTQRYWDGVQWKSEPVYPPQAPPPLAPSQQAPAAMTPTPQDGVPWRPQLQQRVVPVERNIWQWWVHVLKKDYANFSGRARRKEYWSFVLVNALILAALFVPLVIIIGVFGEDSAPADVFAVFAGLGMLVLLLGTFIPSIAVGIRRLHDSGKSGWWILLAVIPIVNYVGGIVILVFNLFDGTPQANQYGPDPKGRG